MIELTLSRLMFLMVLAELSEWSKQSVDELPPTDWLVESSQSVLQFLAHIRFKIHNKIQRFKFKD